MVTRVARELTSSICHVRDDGDLRHGRKSDNEALYRLQPRYPAVIVDVYDGVFHDVEKQAPPGRAHEPARALGRDSVGRGPN